MIFLTSFVQSICALYSWGLLLTLKTFLILKNHFSLMAGTWEKLGCARGWVTIFHWKVKQLWRVEGFIILLNYDAYLVGSGGLEIWVSSTSFQKSNIGWPQQPPTERVSNISEKLDFWWSIPKKRTVIGHLGSRDDQTIRINKFLDEMRLSRSLRPLRL